MLVTVEAGYSVISVRVIVVPLDVYVVVTVLIKGGITMI